MSIKRTITIGGKRGMAEKGPLGGKELFFRRKPNPAGKCLVVVESPAKAKTIQRILGDKYKVMASMGHVRDLPRNVLGVNVNDHFRASYIPAEGRERVILELQKEANKSCNVLLATDPDREGEAISWHLSKLLDVNPKENVRITFHEITRPAILEAVKHPRPIDESKADAQQARRVMDRLVGYKLSPWLWKYVYRGLSAGRVQSVVVRLICDREKEIEAFVPEEYWTIDAKYKDAAKETFKARLTQFRGKEIRITDEDEAERAVNDIDGKDAIVTSVVTQKKQRRAKPPFTTSTMQQEAVNKLSFASKKTMMLAQQLYEGVEIPGHGHVGLISYMRTDSTRISAEMVKVVLPYIVEKYGPEYVPEKPNVYAASKDAQDAHEAIRPTNLNFEPHTLEGIITRDQLRLYTLIWNRFMASQMAAQRTENTAMTLECDDYQLRATGMRVLFDGFTVIQSPKERAKENEKENILPVLRKGDVVHNIGVNPEQHFTTPPPRYTEAGLIKALEEKGIGRPSTYAPILDTIQTRKYVKKENKQFYPTETGFTVCDLLKKYFENIVDVDFTADMESKLDKIADGNDTYAGVLDSFYSSFAKELADADKEAGEEKEKNKQVTDVICEKCGAHMVVRMSRYGKFLACPNYPRCRNTKPYGDDRPQAEVSDTPCPKCGKLMVYRQGPYGRYLYCRDCKETKSIMRDTGVKCPKCGKGTFLERRSKRGRVFYGCSNYPECDMALWNEPTDKICPLCGSVMVKRTAKNGTETVFCSNPECKNAPKKAKRPQTKKKEE